MRVVRAQPKASHGRVDFACQGGKGQRPSLSLQLRPAGRAKTWSGMEAEGRNRLRVRLTTARPRSGAAE